MHKKAEQMSTPTFRDLGLYPREELRKVRFPNGREASKAILLFGDTPALKQMPFLFADAFTFLVPQDAIELLKLLKLRFKVYTLDKLNGA